MGRRDERRDTWAMGEEREQSRSTATAAIQPYSLPPTPYSLSR